MATIQTFYLHNAATPVAGTLPGASTQSASVTPSVTASGASTNRSMDGTVGTAQVSIALTTLAQTAAQWNWFRRFVSPALAAQTITAAISAWTVDIGFSQSNTNSNFKVDSGVLYAWRPSTGALVGRLFDHSGSGAASAGTIETFDSESFPANAGPSQTIQDGDVLIYELWGVQNQGMSTAYTNTFFYDGTTSGSATSVAAALTAPSALTLAAAAAAATPPPKVVSQAVQRAATRCWKRRPSGIVVPRLWTPEAA